MNNCAHSINLTSLADCEIQTSIFENIINNKSFIFSKQDEFVFALNNKIGRIEIIFNKESNSYLNYISFKILNDANITVFINEIISLVCNFIYFFVMIIKKIV